MKICVAQTQPVRGNIQANIERHCALIEQAVLAGADAIFFPELSLTGYEPTLAATLAITPDDARLVVFQQLSEAHRLVIGVGVPTRQASGVCISLVIFRPDQPVHLYEKQYLHPDEEPFFIRGTGSASVIVNEQPIALAICYELSVSEHTEAVCTNGVAVYLASVAKSVRGIANAHHRLAAIAGTYAIPVLMSNCIGEADGELCAGQSSIWKDTGELIGQLDDLSEGILLLDTTTYTGMAITI